MKLDVNCLNCDTLDHINNSKAVTAPPHGWEDELSYTCINLGRFSKAPTTCPPSPAGHKIISVVLKICQLQDLITARRWNVVTTSCQCIDATNSNLKSLPAVRKNAAAAAVFDFVPRWLNDSWKPRGDLSDCSHSCHNIRNTTSTPTLNGLDFLWFVHFTLWPSKHPGSSRGYFKTPMSVTRRQFGLQATKLTYF